MKQIRFIGEQNAYITAPDLCDVMEHYRYLVGKDELYPYEKFFLLSVENTLFQLYENKRF